MMLPEIFQPSLPELWVIRLIGTVSSTFCNTFKIQIKGNKVVHHLAAHVKKMADAMTRKLEMFLATDNQNQNATVNFTTLGRCFHVRPLCFK